MGSIVAVHPSDDRVVHKVTVKTAHSVLIRPTAKLCYISDQRPE
jgi:hypothetical protein